MPDDIERRVIRLIDNRHNRPRIEVKTTTDLVHDLGFDAQDCGTLIRDLEAEFNIEIGDGEVTGIAKVQDIIDVITSQRGP